MTIKDSDYEELSKLDIGSWFGKEWKEETIPCLLYTSPSPRDVEESGGGGGGG